MNPKPLLKHFPELAHLPQEQQEALLQQAHANATGGEKRIETWRNNIFSLAIITGAALALTFWLGPALGMSAPATGAVIMVVFLPVFIYVQQRRYIGRLKPEVASLLRKGG